MKTEITTTLALVGALGLLAACDRSGLELLPQPNDSYPAVIEIGEMQVLPTGSVNGLMPSDCNIADDEGRANCYYGQLSPTDGVTQGGATFSFRGTGGSVCVVVDPEALFWNQFIGTTDSAVTWGYPDVPDDDGDLDLFGGLSTYYTGSPGIEMGDFKGFYTDSLGRQIEIDYTECFNESPYFEGEEAHAGRGAPEYCTIDTEGREGIEYTIVLETFSVPRDDGILAFATAVVDGTCRNAGIDECSFYGETVELDGSVRTCSVEREVAFCNNGQDEGETGPGGTGGGTNQDLTKFCCANPSACGDDPPADLCEEVDVDAFCSENPDLCDCAG